MYRASSSIPGGTELGSSLRGNKLSLFQACNCGAANCPPGQHAVQICASGWGGMKIPRQGQPWPPDKAFVSELLKISTTVLTANRQQRCSATQQKQHTNLCRQLCFAEQ